MSMTFIIINFKNFFQKKNTLKIEKWKKKALISLAIFQKYFYFGWQNIDPYLIQASPTVGVYTKGIMSSTCDANTL